MLFALCIWLAVALIGRQATYGLNWDEWWTYDGVSGPEFWSAYNPDWRLCSLGRHQSPVNIEPDALVYSKRLPMLKVQDQATEVIVTNTGHGIVLKFPTGSSSSSKASPPSAREVSASASARFHHSSQRVSLSLINRPPSALYDGQQSAANRKTSNQKISTSSYLPPHLYDNPSPSSSSSSVETEHFVVQELHLHWGSKDRQGSEHRIGGRSFAGEAQIFAFNQRMYDNFTHAQAFAHGILAVSVFIQLATLTSPSSSPTRASSVHSTAPNNNKSVNQQLDALGRLLPRLRFKSETATMHKFYLYDFLPHDVSEYVMYDGSLTQPSCAESVTWMVLNRPVYISADVLDELRRTRQGPPQRPGSIMEDNFRSPQPLGRRILLTNIDLRYPATNANVVGDENEVPFYMDRDNDQRRSLLSSEMCPSMSSSVYGDKHYVVNEVVMPSGL